MNLPKNNDAAVYAPLRIFLLAVNIKQAIPSGKAKLIWFL